MPVTFDLESVQGVAIGVGHGVLTVDEIKKFAAGLWQQLEGAVDRVLWDLSGARFDLTPAQVRELADFAKAHSPGGELRSAFVVAADLEFGLVRMFEAFREMEGARIAVFRDRPSAIAWLQSEAE